jgi:hypothetical protein
MIRNVERHYCARAVMQFSVDETLRFTISVDDSDNGYATEGRMLAILNICLQDAYCLTNATPISSGIEEECALPSS